MPDASPAKWHLAHTSWYFETFVLKSRDGYTPFDAQFEYLFNSYYNGVGDQFPRPRRGLLSRPTVAEVYAYRRHVDQAMDKLFSDPDRLSLADVGLIVLGIAHEEQHQELLLTDIKHMFAQNPCRWLTGRPRPCA